MVGEAAEEIFHQLGLQVAHLADLDEVLVDQGGTAAEIDRGHGQGFVHGQDEVARPVDALTVAQRLGEELSEHDADVLHGVVLIDIEVAGGPERQVEAAVAGEQLQHVVEEADAGVDLVAALALDAEGAVNAGFARVALDGGASHAASRARPRRLISSMTARACSAWSRATSSE